VDDLSSPVVIIGAGVAGLACALTLQRQGQPFTVLEKSDQVGGRIKTSVTDDQFRVDHGFQVLLTSYPELDYFLDMEELQLKNFNSGALIYTPEKTRLLANPFVHPQHLLNEAFSDFLSLKDKTLVLKLIFHEPFYKSYIENSLQNLFAQSGLVEVEKKIGFLTKSVLGRVAVK
jgi:phytoene dehydrogenase-like protein